MQNQSLLFDPTAFISQMQWNEQVLEIIPPKSDSEIEEEQPDVIYRDKYGKKINTNNLHRELGIEDALIEPVQVVNDHKKDKEKKRNLRIDDPMYKEFKDTSRIPIYNGDFPNNRFDIAPGYRWDGVDRSNEFEQRYLQAHNSVKEISYFDEL